MGLQYFAQYRRISDWKIEWSNWREAEISDVKYLGGNIKANEKKIISLILGVNVSYSW